MERLILILIIGLLSGSAFAAPFGFKMGMTLKEIEKKCTGKAEYIENDAYLVQPQKNILLSRNMLFLSTKIRDSTKSEPPHQSKKSIDMALNYKVSFKASKTELLKPMVSLKLLTQ